MMNNNLTKSDYNLFIDNNALRYMEIFSDNEYKKVFIHQNWVAFAFTGPWLFYRKMYKVAVIMILSLVILLAGSFIISHNIGENLKAEIDKEPVSYEKFEFLEDDEIKKHLSGEDIDNLYTDYDDKKVKKAEVDFFVWVIPTILFFGVKLVFSLFSDCIYRRFIFKNINKKSGGTSGTAATVCSCIYIGIFVIAVFLSNIV